MCTEIGFFFGHGTRVLLFPMLVLFFTAFNYLEASLPALVSRVAPADRKGTALGVYSTSQFLGTFLGGAMGGWLYGQSGIEGVFLFGAAVALLWLALALKMPESRRLHRIPQVDEHS
jgi:predicted MFS family arabinose efflux permease